MTFPLRLRNLQVDAPPDVHDATVAWWAAALGGTPRATDGPYTHLDGVRAHVGVHVQRQDQGPGGYHLDLETDDVAGEVARVVALGATPAGDAGPYEDAVLLADPAGLLFCITQTGQEQLLTEAGGDHVDLRVLMFDVPANLAATQADFWAAALGGEAAPVGDAYPEYTWIKGVSGPGGPINVAVQEIAQGNARLHVDLHLENESARDADVARLVTAGATALGNDSAHWRVLTDPAGNLACVVPDAKA